MRPALPAGPVNIIILSVDTLRADRLGCFGYKQATSPNLDKLVKKGLLFPNALTNVPLTNPSFASLFTSHYPHETGAIRNGIPMVDGFPTLAMVMKKHGYNTAAVISNWPLKRHLSKLDLGFDLYDDDFHDKRWVFFNNERDAEEVTERAVKWIEDGPKEPFFAWIHYSDPHAPYLKHQGFEFDSGGINSSNYDSEVAYTDHYIGDLLLKLEQKGLLSRSLVVFISDHGESLGEHDYIGHGRNLYQPSLRVPLALIGPGLTPGTRSDAAVQLLDLEPTILSYAGIKAKLTMRGLDLMPFIRGEKPWPDRTLYFETYPGAAPQVPGAEKMLDQPIWVGSRHGTSKIMFSVRYQKWELYDLVTDPAELHNLVNIRDPEFIAASDDFLSWYREWENKAVVGEINVMTDEDRQRFKALGYIEGP
jgi:arylsulfatase A-like enzyme